MIESSALKLACIFVCACLCLATKTKEGKRFGGDGPFLTLDQVENLSTQNFFDNYVRTKKAVVLKSGCKRFPAYAKWSDRYLFEKASKYDDVKLTVETVKKESRNQKILALSLGEFLTDYVSNEYYLVNEVPGFLSDDIVLPQPLQCNQAVDTLDQVLMWFSSGNTSSVTHTDDYENILCILAGRKDLIMVDYYKYEDIANVLIDISPGSYSSMDVDNVDYSKFPGIENLEYYSVSLDAGDCLYIPYRWIHQVRSYNRNIAVNFWFNYEKIYSNHKFEKKCSMNEFDSFYSLDKLNLKTEEFNEFTNFKYFIIRQINNGFTKFEHWKSLILKDVNFKDNSNEISNLESLIIEFYSLLDINGNGEIELDELDLEQKTMEQISDLFNEIDTIVKDFRLNDDNSETNYDNENDDKEEL